MNVFTINKLPNISKSFNSIFSSKYISIMDELCIHKLFNNKGIIKSQLSIFNNYLSNRFIDSKDLNIAANRIKHSIEYLPKCPTCKINTLAFIGKPSKMFSKYCSCKCSAQNPNTTRLKQRSLYDKWGSYHCYDSSLYRKQYKEKFGVEYFWQRPDIKAKRKQTLLTKFNTTNLHSVDSIRSKIESTNISKYGVSNPMLNETIKLKKFNSEKSNYSRFSKPELTLKTYLESLYPGDIITQYSSEFYPFKCDFYIKSLDVYIEYHGSHFHNFKLFDMNNSNDITMLEQLKQKSLSKSKHPNQYDMIIYTWTDLDVRKHNYALKNSLKYLVYYSLPSLEVLQNDILSII